MRDIYVTNSGTLSRKENSLFFENKEQKRTIPIQDVDNIYIFSEVTINSKLLDFLSKLDISIYFFNYYGFYSGTFAPRKKAISGKLLIEQVNHYNDDNKRLIIAKEFVLASIHNMRKKLMQYELKEEAEKMNTFKGKIEAIGSTQNLMLREAEAKEFYYKQLNKIIKDPQFAFVKRTRQPPDNYINSLISFGNSLLYTTTLSEILKTQLDPTIAYLHEPFERRYSLNLDIADIFKPLIVDRIIFSLINRQQLKPTHFDRKLNYCYLNKEGRIIFLKEYDAKLKTTLRYPGINRNVSYKYMLRLECYKLIKTFLEGKRYNAFKIYW